MMSSFLENPAMVWLLVALVLGGIELLTLSFFLLWPAIAALIVAAIAWMFPDLAWGWQIVIFALTSVALLVPGRRWIRRTTLAKNEEMVVNNKSVQLIGRLGYIVSGKDGIYRVKLGDTVWGARGSKSLKTDEQVRVTGVDGIMLNIEKA